VFGFALFGLPLPLFHRKKFALFGLAKFWLEAKKSGKKIRSEIPKRPKKHGEKTAITPVYINGLGKIG